MRYCCKGDGEERGSKPGRLRVLVADADAALFGLLAEWLAAEGCCVMAEHAHAVAADRADVVLVDLPFPRQSGRDVLKRLALEHPGIPIVALSSGFFPGIALCGAVARALGVASVLAKPVTREALVGALRQVTDRGP